MNSIKNYLFEPLIFSINNKQYKKDSIADIEYECGKIRIGLRANGIPVNVFVDRV
jgi:hypothetical protein